MLTVTATAPVIPTSTLVVVDPFDENLIHAHSACTELSALVDLVERWTDARVECPDKYEAALVDLGLTLPIHASVGLRSCPVCWGN